MNTGFFEHGSAIASLLDNWDSLTPEQRAICNDYLRLYQHWIVTQSELDKNDHDVTAVIASLATEGHEQLEAGKAELSVWRAKYPDDAANIQLEAACSIIMTREQYEQLSAHMTSLASLIPLDGWSSDKQTAYQRWCDEPARQSQLDRWMTSRDTERLVKEAQSQADFDRWAADPQNAKYLPDDAAALERLRCRTTYYPSKDVE